MKRCQTENLLLRFPNCSFELFYCQPSNQKGLFWLLQKWRKCERFQSNIPQLWSAKYDKNVSFYNHFIDKRQFVLRKMPSEMNVWHWIGLDTYDISYPIWSNLHLLYCQCAGKKIIWSKNANNSILLKCERPRKSFRISANSPSKGSIFNSNEQKTSSQICKLEVKFTYLCHFCTAPIFFWPSQNSQHGRSMNEIKSIKNVLTTQFTQTSKEI